MALGPSAFAAAAPPPGGSRSDPSFPSGGFFFSLMAAKTLAEVRAQIGRVPAPSPLLFPVPSLRKLSGAGSARTDPRQPRGPTVMNAYLGRPSACPRSSSLRPPAPPSPPYIPQHPLSPPHCPPRRPALLLPLSLHPLPSSAEFPGSASPVAPSLRASVLTSQNRLPPPPHLTTFPAPRGRVLGEGRLWV